MLVSHNLAIDKYKMFVTTKLEFETDWIEHDTSGVGFTIFIVIL